MFKSVVYQGNNLLGEVEVYPLDHKSYILSKEIRISHYSKQSERCSPLSILHTIAPNGLSFKMESKSLSSSLGSLHSTCLSESKTAVMQLGEEEFHLVAMSSRTDSELYSYFWCFIVSKGLYDSCLTMLNLRCLGIVFDLDETLVVANTMRSFEDRIEALQRKISTENPQRVDSILAEIKRYHEDKAILKQYLDNDQVVDNGMVFKTQSEVVLALSENIPQTARPIVRLPEKNIILTRINPANRDTSVLVRLRPAWEDLRNYLTARGRKRFEVYVCTMAEKDYALEMWRLLDPGLNLINSKELLDRIVCVKAGSRKSLLSVFHDGICHPKMALVIDDRLKVWDEKDQSRVHVVPPFVPYYAPQAEVNNTVPVLCVARNVACNVRGNFFKEFDEGLLQSLSDVFYEDNVPDITAPDVGNYLISEDDASGSNKDPLRLEGISDIEVERRLKEANPSPAVVVTDLESRLAPLQFAVSTSSNTISQPQSEGPSMPFHSIQLPQTASVVKLLPSTGLPQSSSQGSPGREEGELPESDVDPDTRRRILILQHGQDRRDNMPMDTPFPVTPPVQASPPPVQSHRGWPPLEEDVSMRQPNQSVPKPVPRKFPTESETIQFDKQRPSLGSYFQGMEGSVSSDRNHFNNRKFKEARRVDHHPRLKHPFSSYRSMPGNKPSLGPLAKSIKDSYVENGSDNSFYPAETPFDVLQRIAKECQTKVELKPALSNSTELQFTVEVWFAGEKIGEGNGRTRKEAQHLAGECAISTLADKYLSSEKLNNLSQQNESDVMRDSTSFGRGQSLKEEHPYSTLTTTSAAPSGRYLDARMMENGSKKPLDSVSALKQLCFKEGLALMFIKGQQTTISNPLQREEEQALVEIGGKLLGRGTGSTMEEAKIEAAEEALDNLKSIYATQKSASSPKPLPFFANKRMKPDSARILDQYSSLSRYW